jgi:CHAT domain-containing protein/tetratricopeptide (TPR) repeat protein
MSMSRLVAICLAAWLTAAAGAQPPKPAPLTKEQQVKLQDRDRLQKKAEQLQGEGKLPEAIAAAEKMLAIEREVFGNVHPQVARSLQFLAKMYETQADFPAARQAREEVLAIQKKLIGADHWQGTDARIALEDSERLARMSAADRRRLAEAFQMGDQVGHLYQQGKTREALALAQKVRDISLELLGEHHPDYALSLNNLAFLYWSQGAFAKAEPLYRQAVEIKKQALGEHHPGYASGLHNLARLYYSQGRYNQAEPLYRQALEIRKQTLGERHPDYATSLNNLAALYRARGDNAQAEALYGQEFEIVKQTLGPRHPDYATCLHNLATVYHAQGQYAQAEPLYHQALDLRKQLLGARHPDCASTLHNLAVLCITQGEYAKAEPLLLEALKIRKQALGERHPDYSQALNTLAGLYWSRGEYERAEPRLRQALAIAQETLGDRHPDYALRLHNLGVLYRDQGEYAKAEPLLRQALQVQKEVLGEHHPFYAMTLTNLARLYLLQGEYAKAEPLLRQALQINRQVLGERHPEYAASLNNLALLYKTQGDYAQAEPLYCRAIAAMRRRPDDDAIPVQQLTAADLRPLPATVAYLANYCVLQEQHLGAQPTVAQLRSLDHDLALTLAMRERLRQEVLEQDASKLWHGAEAADLIARRIGVCRQLFDREGNAADLETALAVAEQGTARVFLDQLGKARAQSVGRISPALRQQEAEFRNKLRVLDPQITREQARPDGQRDPDRIGKLLDEMKDMEMRLDQLIRQMEKDYPQYAALKYPRPCSLAEARACLHANEVALLFVPGNDHFYVLLVEARPARNDKANGLAIVPLPGYEQIADNISCLTDRDTFEHPLKTRAVAARTYDLLLAPLKERLRGKDLVIVAGGPLAYLPFEVLVEDGHYLIEQHRIRYAPSLTALHLVHLWEQTRPQPERQLWALADPVYDQADQRVKGEADLAQASKDALAEYLSRAHRGDRAAGVPYPRLHFSGEEVRAIRALLGAADGDVLTGLQATEAAVKTASEKGLLARARYVHLATHGILGLDTGQPPALVLSLLGNDGQRDADGGVNDGFLRLDEVTRLKLNADLVVLSACETGQGRLHAGEGVTGLARAFLSAGSRGVVCSLWSVDDRETATFMARLYAGLKDGQAAADALRAAKLAMIRAGKAPVYWAPFILIGE